MTATATLAHPDRLMLHGAAAPVTEVEHAVALLAAQMAEIHGDELQALESVARAARHLARTRRHEVRFEEERPVPAMGSWSFENGGAQIVRGEN
jgi:hypothetical protein